MRFLRDVEGETTEENRSSIRTALSRSGLTVSRIDFAICALLFVLFFSVYFLNLRHLEPLAFDRIDLFFGADSRLVVNEMTGYDQHTPRALFAPTTRFLVNLFEGLLELDTRHSVISVLALLAAVAISLAYLILRRLTLSVVPAVGFSVLYASLFANLVIFSVPETYVLSNLVILVFLFVLMTVKENIGRTSVLYLAAFAGFAGLYNPPLLSLVVTPLLLAYRLRSIYQMLLPALLLTGIAVSFFVISNFLVQGFGMFTQFGSMANQWGSMSHFLEPRSIGLVLSNSFAFAIISPVEKLRTYLVLSHAGGYFDSWLRGV
ncbi:MAG: hypothetical protein JSV66_01795, partial [Trueperaceae bacterium]